MWIHKIKKKKMQFVLILLILFMSTGILAGCISFTFETTRFVDEYYGVDNCPMYFAMLSQDHGKELLLEDEKASQYISKIEPDDAKYVTETMYINGKKMSNLENFFYELKDVRNIGYSMSIADGDEKNAPGDQEIWISQIYADANHLKPGDVVQFGSKSGEGYQISAIVNTAQCSSGFIDNYPFYVNQKTLQELPGKQTYALRIYTDDPAVTLKQISNALPEKFNQMQISLLDRGTLKMCLTILSGIFGGVGTAAAAVIFAVSVIIIRYLVRATIAKEYRMIGIYKALGRTEREISRIYFISYMLPGVTGILAGTLAVKPLAIFLGKSVLGRKLDFSLSAISVWVSGAVILVMAAVLAVNLLLELKKLRKISPVQAMNLNALSSKEKVCKSVIPAAHSSFSMALNGIFKSPGMSCMIVLILAVSIFLDMMAGATGLTLANYAGDRQIWENLPAYDGYIKLSGEDDALEKLKNAPEVEDYVCMTLHNEYPDMEFENSDMTSTQAHPMVYSDFNEKRYAAVPFKKGRICVNSHEIAVSESFLNNVNKKVGEYLTISTKEHSVDFLITGSYSAMILGGTSFYILEEDMKELGLKCKMENALFFLKDGVSYEKFEENFETQLSSSKICRDFAFIEQEGKTVGDIAYPICIVVFMAFTLFSILNLVNLVYTQNRENRRKYGILKAMGFTTGYIRREILFQLTLECVAATVLAVVLHITVSPLLFSLASGIYYIQKPVWLTVAVCSGMYVVLMLITMILLIPVRKITPVELMEE